MNGPCVGNTPAVPSIGYPSLCLEGEPLGVRYADLVSAFPAGVNTAATWNRTLIRARGVAMGEEFRGKGVHVHLGPDMNIMRTAAAGRNWEGFGADPYLSGEASYETITGVQSVGVQASAKHFINNEQEHFRENSNSKVDDRTQHEIYLAPFLKSAMANVASFMCGYNQINGTYSCENDKMLNDVVKGEFGYPGYVMSDWAATHSTLAVNSGLDMTMPGDKTYGSNTTYFGQELIDAVTNGDVPEERVSDMALRILASWYYLGQDEGYPETNFYAWDLNDPSNQHIDVQADHGSLIREIGAASTVLLKNENGTLPLAAPSSLAIIGAGARTNSQGINGCVDRACNDGILAQGWGSGTAEYPYLIAPIDAITSRAEEDGTDVTSSLNDDTSGAAQIAAAADFAIVFISSDSGEGYLTVEDNAGDRNDLFAWHDGDALVQAVADANNNTIVCVNSVGAMIVEAWIDHPNVKAVVWSGLPGQEAGNSVTDILYGAYNPSGRLPYTIAKSEDDYSASVLYTADVEVPDINYSEGLFVDYRHFDANDIEPRFEFGFGLSYTTFEYADLVVEGSAASDESPPTGPGSSLDPWLHEPVVTVSFTIENTADVAGHEVHSCPSLSTLPDTLSVQIPQLYVTFPEAAESAPLNLKGFDSVYVAPGDVAPVSLELSRYDLSVWDVMAQSWVVPEGEATISIGASSRDIRLTGTVTN
ncbi:glycoside hydrolase family 3 protein [Schizophyllum amplum]|uniref:beta-glucosidase n=1 Tax=Schizophyllum amplum TaxID=97359 RepID=A0A550C9L1_9AGAR|nr:glycoside hydrolase family 3 protein [Auriculariopsis ampla]